MLRKQKRLAGSWFLVISGALALAALAVYLIWAPAHHAFHAIVPAALAAGAAAEALLYFTDVSYLGVAATALFSTAFFTLLSDSVGSFVDAFQGIVMFGDSSQLGIILLISTLIFACILLSILSCFVKRRD